MKLFLASLFFSVSAFAAENPATVEASTPKQVCEALAKAAAENNYKAFSDWTAMPMMGAHDCPMKGDGKECDAKNCPMHKEGKGGKGKMAKGRGHGHGHGMHGMNEDGFKKMHEKEMDKLKDLNCKEEKVAGNYAWVEATSQNETRLVPFKMIDGKWKFDLRTYHSFYHAPAKETNKQ